MPHKLLLADDSVTIQRVIELTFADEDVSVTAVGDGKQAIERIEADPPDIVLADVGMPEKDGYEVADYVKRTPRLAHIPVLLLTGAFEPVDEDRAVRVGCDGVLAKPFEPQMVITRVRELLSANAAPASRPTPHLIPPSGFQPGRITAEPRQAPPVPQAPPPATAPEPLLPPPPPPLSAGPTPIVPLPVVPSPPPVPPKAPPAAESPLPSRHVEVRLPGGDDAPAVSAPAVFAPAEERVEDVPEVSASDAPDARALPADDDETTLVAEAPVGATMQPSEPEPPATPTATGEVTDDRNPEELAVESALDAAIRIRRRPTVAVPEIGVPPRGLASEVDRAPLMEPRRPSDAKPAPPAVPDTPVQARVDDGPSTEAAPPPAPVPTAKADPGPEPEAPAKLDDYFERLDAAFATLGQKREKPSPASVAPPMEVPEETPPAEPVHVPAASGGLAQAFSALLDAERGQPGGGPVPALFAPPSISPALREELVEQVTHRVLERLSDRVVRETVTDLVSRVTERLVREEIERLKNTIK